MKGFLIGNPKKRAEYKRRKDYRNILNKEKILIVPAQSGNSYNKKNNSTKSNIDEQKNKLKLEQLRLQREKLRYEKQKLFNKQYGNIDSVNLLTGLNQQVPNKKKEQKELKPLQF